MIGQKAAIRESVVGPPRDMPAVSSLASSDRAKGDLGSAALLLSCLFAITVELMCTAVPNETTTILSLVAVTQMLLIIAFVRPMFYLKYLIFVFGVVANLVGVFVCEWFSFYLVELRVSSSFAGSFPLIALSRTLFLLILLVFDSTTERQEKSVEIPLDVLQKRVHIADTCTLLVAAVGLVMFLDVMRFSPAFVLGETRFAWRLAHEALLPAFVTSNYLYAMIIPFISMLYGNRRRGIISAVIYLSYLFWVGSKFGSFFHLFCLLLWAALPKLYGYGAYRIRRIVFGSLLAVIGLILGAVFIHVAFTGSTVRSNDYLFQRVAQQGQLWWRTYDIVDDNGHPDEFQNEMATWGSRTEENAERIRADYGISKIMYLTAPASAIDSKLAGGSSFTESSHASMYYYFGPTGVIIFSLIMGVAAALFVRLTLKSIMAWHIIDAVVLARCCWCLFRALSMTSWSIFGPLSIACYIYLISAALIRGTDLS